MLMPKFFIIIILGKSTCCKRCQARSLTSLSSSFFSCSSTVASNSSTPSSAQSSSRSVLDVLLPGLFASLWDTFLFLTVVVRRSKSESEKSLDSLFFSAWKIIYNCTHIYIIFRNILFLLIYLHIFIYLLVFINGFTKQNTIKVFLN